MLSISSWRQSTGDWVKSWRAQPAPPVPVVVVPVPVPAPRQSSTSFLDSPAARVAVLALAATGAATLVGAALYRYAQPFPRGRQSRSKTSLPFAAGEEPDASVAHQFFSPAEYKFIDLSHGRVRYILRSPASSPSAGAAASSTTVAPGGASSSDESDPGSAASSPLVVLVHGFSIACDIWKQQSDALVAAGHTVLCFDNYGRGWSDSPDGLTADCTLYTSQLAELLFALNIRRPVDLCGVSMGGAIVTAFAALYPRAVNRLVMICPAGLPVATPKSFARTMSIPLLGGYLFRKAIGQMQAKGAAAQWEQVNTACYRAWGSFARQNIREHPGFVRVLHKTVTEFTGMSDMRKEYAVLAANKKLQILIIWGEKDGLTPYANAAVLQSLLPNSKLVTIVDSKHNMMIERAQPINEVLVAWLADSHAPLPARVHTTLRDQEPEGH